MTLKEAQGAGAVFMVHPARFGFNPETAVSNVFQQAPQSGGSAGHAAAVETEFAALASALQAAGVRVIVGEDTPWPVKPDAIFPNNWVSFHQDGTVVLYPMLAPNRRLERRDELIDAVRCAGPYRITRTVDLSGHERENKYLEGTGSVVLDRSAHIAYACLSPRTDLAVLGDFAQQLDYELVTFEAVDAQGVAIYHTNVLMSVGTHFAVVCTDSIRTPQHRAAVSMKLRATGHEIVAISLGQMQRFAGNVLELAGARGPLIALSTTAWTSLLPAQRRVLERYAQLLTVDVPTIERIGGGGVRCMLAEVHLPAHG
jgi:hypothetical protein